MTVLMLLVFIAAGGLGIGAMLVVVVIIGVRLEERRATLLEPKPPGVSALLARHVLGACRPGPRDDDAR